MRKTDFRLAIFRGDVKNDVRAGPFVLVFHKAQMAVGNMPGDLLAGTEESGPQCQDHFLPAIS